MNWLLALFIIIQTERQTNKKKYTMQFSKWHKEHGFIWKTKQKQNKIQIHGQWTTKNNHYQNKTMKMLLFNEYVAKTCSWLAVHSGIQGIVS